LKTSKETPLTQKMKDYLVGIFYIEEKKPVARLGEIAAALRVRGPSAHIMVKMLADRQLVTYEKYGYINLTDKGREIAEQLKNKDNTIKYFLIQREFPACKGGDESKFPTNRDRR